MMKTPCRLAALTASLSAGAISLTLLAADLHQWSSHISQMIIAVRDGSHVTRRTFGSEPAVALLRKLSAKSLAASMEFAMMAKDTDNRIAIR